MDRTLSLNNRSAKGKPERRPERAAELVRRKVDVIVTSPASPLIRAAQGATRTIPIVMAGVFVDPVDAGFVTSLARPGGNITGVTNLEWDLHPKRLELLKEAFPGISRVVILWPGFQQERGMKEVEAAGKALGIQIQSLIGIRARASTVNRESPVESTFSTIDRERPDGLLVATSAPNIRHRKAILEFTAKRRLPTIYARSRFVDQGGLMS